MRRLDTKSKEGLRALSYAIRAFDVDATFFLFQQMMRQCSRVDTGVNNPDFRNEEKHQPIPGSTSDPKGDNVRDQNCDNGSDIDIFKFLNIDLRRLYHGIRSRCTWRIENILSVWAVRLWHDGLAFEAFVNIRRRG